MTRLGRAYNTVVPTRGNKWQIFPRLCYLLNRRSVTLLLNSTVVRKYPRTCRSGGFHRDKQCRTAGALARQAGRGDRGTACRNYQGRAGTGTGREPPVAPARTRFRDSARSPGECRQVCPDPGGSEVARLKEKNKELQFKLRQMWDWHNNEITKTGGLTFKASSLIAKALHPDAPPSEEIRLEAFKAFSAWKSDRDVARRR